MSFEVGVTDWFESAHSLKGKAFGGARRIHGHTYKVELIVEGSKLSKGGMLVDIGEIKRALSQAIRDLNYALLDDVDALTRINTTAEELARYIHAQASRKIKNREAIGALKVVVWENRSNFASFKARI